VQTRKSSTEAKSCQVQGLDGADNLTPGFYRYVAVSVSVTVSVKTVSVLPFRKRRCSMPLPFTTERRMGVSNCHSAAGPVGWPASFPRIRVGGAPGVLATATEK